MDIGVEIRGLGVSRVAVACGVRPQAVNKWIVAGRLPRTEWTGETNYARIIVRLSGGRLSREELVPRLPKKDKGDGADRARP